MRRAQASRRGGFTLIEMLVVIGIIILLVGLLVPAVQKARDSATRARTKNEISGLATGIENFKATYLVTYVPSGFVLAPNYAPPFPNPTNAQQVAANRAYQESRDFYSKVWPKAISNGNTNVPQPPGSDQGGAANLDGNQLLVFLLGGIPPQGTKGFTGAWAGDRSGFLNSPTNPFAVGLQTPGVAGPLQSATQAKPQFFDFDPKRVDQFGHFLDPYGTPYYFFGSKYGNDYDLWGVFAAVINPTNLQGGFTPQGGYGYMNPHVGLDGKFVEPSGYQIISAGKDQVPSQGGILSGVPSPKWDPNSLWPGGGAYKVNRSDFPNANSNLTGGGADDIANFSPYTLNTDK